MVNSPFRPLTPKNGIIELASLPDGVVRVRAGRRKKLPAYQSLAVINHGEHREHGEFNSARSVVNFDMQIVLGIQGQHLVARGQLAPEAQIYGLGEKTGWLDKRGRHYTMRNSDVWLEHPAGIGHATDPLYASFPFFIVHAPPHSYGVFVDNPEFTEFDFTREAQYQFSAPASVLNFYILPGPTLPEVLRQYTHLTGHMPLPALWTLGYHQCRWGYASEADIRYIANELRARDLPADAIWFDIDYMDGYRVFTWDKKDFPRPKQLVADLRAQGFRAVTIVDPGVKVDRTYAVYQQGRRGQHFIKHSSGKEYNGSVWPGRSAFPDFHHAETRVWWAGHVQHWLNDFGLSGLWNDMNEPAATDLTGPIADARHAAGQWPHASARNTYALQMARATFDGMLAHRPDSRPFILTRAAFAGAQTVAALWCGDNHSCWEHLAGSLPMLMNMGLSGMPFVGVDIGGFGGDATGELLARWTQVGAFYPFCRNHAATGTRAQEPWRFGPEVEAICRKYIGWRYQLLPYFYNLFREAALTGAPVMRPLVWHYPDDANTHNLNDQFMLGPDMLIAPILGPGLTARAVYLPKGKWYRWSPSASLRSAQEASAGPAHIVAQAPLDELPVFVRGGALIPMWPTAQHTDAIDRAQLTLHLWPGHGQLDVYEDDGETRAFERGAAGWRLTPFRLRQTQNGLTLKWGAPQGHYPTPRSHWTFVVHEFSVQQATLDGKPIAVRQNKTGATLRFADDGQSHTLVLRVR